MKADKVISPPTLPSLVAWAQVCGGTVELQWVQTWLRAWWEVAMEGKGQFLRQLQAQIKGFALGKSVELWFWRDIPYAINYRGIKGKKNTMY
jgi:hypothetical protein